MHDFRYRRPALQQIVRALLEGEPGAGQRLAERARLSIGAVEDGDISQGEAMRGVPSARPVSGNGTTTRRAAGRWPLRSGGLALLITGLVDGDGGRARARPRPPRSSVSAAERRTRPGTRWTARWPGAHR
jgi:hypothetical protein